MNEDERFFDWLAGFIDGEGCFRIHASPGRRSGSVRYSCRFVLGVRADDSEILHEIVRRTGIGTVQPHPRRGIGKPQARWSITSQPECYALVELLDAYPLRAKKAGDFAIWREAVVEWSRDHPKGRDWSPMEALCRALKEGRVYA